MGDSVFNPNFPVNLANCADEPIHIPGAIQPFGLLVAIDDKGIVRAASRNAVDRFPGLAAIGQGSVAAAAVLTFTPMDSSLGADPGEALSVKNQLVRVNLADEEIVRYGIAFREGDLTVVEVEHLGADPSPDSLSYLGDLPRILKEISRHEDLRALAAFTARRVRSLTGFDRVMVYEFDGEWNGEVIAEERLADLDSFLGLHFPASDIPAQARALYARKWIRIIPDVEYAPSPIVPRERQTLDLSDSMLRSVSPIHVRYLGNMGVKASMSISLVVDGKLWGLIACHHYSPHLVDVRTRLGCESYGQLISSRIAHIRTAVNAGAMRYGDHLLHEIVKAFGEEPDFRIAANAKAPELLALFRCDGMTIRLGKDTVNVGECPSDAWIGLVSQKIKSRSVLDPYVSTNVGAEVRPSKLPASTIAGVVGLSLSKREDYFILGYRREVEMTVNWAGRPPDKEKIDFDDPGARLRPRGSFALWQENHRGTSLRWENDIPDSLRRFALLFVKIVVERHELLEKANTDLMSVNRAKDEFVAMVSHELRTPLNSIIGWTELALSGELEEGKLPEALKIIQRNARSQNQLVSDLLDVSRILAGKLRISVKNMRVSEIAEAVVLSFAPTTQNRNIQVIAHLGEDSDTIIGDPQRIQQVIWNLLSNAVKFSPKGGKIWVRLRRVHSQVELEIRDEGIGLEQGELKRIFERFQQVDSSVGRKAGGLGLGLAISRHIAELHGGTVIADSEGIGKGSSFTLRLPIGPVTSEVADESFFADDEAVAPKPASTTRLKGKVILVVEDEPDASRFLQLLLTANGAHVYACANGAEAVELLRHRAGEISTVLSDVGMPVMDGYALARAIRASVDPRIRDVCAIALTAYGRAQDRIAALKAGFNSYIAKPVNQEELLTVLETFCGMPS